MAKKIVDLAYFSNLDPIPVSQKLSLSQRTEMYSYPTTESVAARMPTSIAPHGCSIKSAEVPTATPPARVAFCMWT